MDAECLGYDDNTFDLIFGRGILHHLNIRVAINEIRRVLKIGGDAIFIEPLIHNPLINCIRSLTPQLRTKDEHPLLMRDIEEAKKYFIDVKVEHFHIFTLLAVPFRNLFFFEKLLNSLYFVDRSLMHIFPFLKRYSWVVVIDLYKSKNDF